MLNERKHREIADKIIDLLVDEYDLSPYECAEVVEGLRVSLRALLKDRHAGLVDF